MFGMGGTPVVVEQLSECKATCLESDDCVAITWDPSDDDDPCWILNEKHEEVHMPGVTKYVRNKGCE